MINIKRRQRTCLEWNEVVWLGDSAIGVEEPLGLKLHDIIAPQFGICVHGPLQGQYHGAGGDFVAGDLHFLENVINGGLDFKCAIEFYKYAKAAQSHICKI